MHMIRMIRNLSNRGWTVRWEFSPACFTLTSPQKDVRIEITHYRVNVPEVKLENRMTVFVRDEDTSRFIRQTHWEPVAQRIC